MADKVVDSSAIAAILFNEPEATSVAARLEDARLFAPALLSLELASVCVTKSRRQPEQRQNLLRWYSSRFRLEIETFDVNVDEAIVLALKTGLSAYDASYLWLAHDLRAELVTLDKKLARAAATA